MPNPLKRLWCWTFGHDRQPYVFGKDDEETMTVISLEVLHFCARCGKPIPRQEANQ